MVIEYVYGLLTKEKEYIYVGVTNNPERRIEQHDGSMKKGKISQFYEMIILDKYEDREQSFIDRLEKQGFVLENKEKKTDIPSREYHIGESLSRERIREKIVYQRNQKYQERLDRKKSTLRKKFLHQKRKRRKLYYLRPDKGFPPIGKRFRTMKNKNGTVGWGCLKWEFKGEKNYSSKYRYNVLSQEGEVLDSDLTRREVMYKYGFNSVSEGPRRDNKGDWYNIESYTIQE